MRTTTILPPDQVALACRGPGRADAFRPLFHTSEAGVRGHVQACVFAYALVLSTEDRLDAAGIDISARKALQDLTRIRQGGQQHRDKTSTVTRPAARPNSTSGCTPPPECRLGPPHRRVAQDNEKRVGDAL